MHFRRKNVRRHFSGIKSRAGKWSTSIARAYERRMSWPGSYLWLEAGTRLWSIGPERPKGE